MTPPEKPAGQDADKTAVITRPGAEAKKKAAKPDTPPAAEEPKPETEETRTVESPTDRVDAGKTEVESGKTEEVSATPPPWQRVTSEAPYAEATQVGPGDEVVPEQQTVALESPAYPASDPDTVAVPRPVPPGLSGGAPRTSVNLGASNGGRPTTGAARRPGRGPRRASLQIKRVDPWSVLKLALVLGVALFFVWLVAVGVLYGVLDGMGVWDKINNTANDLLQGNESSGDPLISAGRVFGVSAIVGAVNIVLFTALATVGAFVYNVSADLAGGLEVTLSERD
ncbi:DUF3566 domain-containing protein [Saccharothrix violaceirubra]|uniref:DUF3566 domain-containing protein n=1 Tax=Saccharothrix violaceirubra TaxID=413306 RepID=A0A7W7TA10_9PSEU|nr:DUF3566 domain-containing protein [Saccharothrix violaceirubra]MBB4969276.1 hypothetical protein [Saccharothrix violaceirubra]